MKMKIKKGATISIIIALIGVIGLVVAAWQTTNYWSSRILPGTNVANINVSGKNISEAKALIEQKTNELNVIVLEWNNYRYPVNLSEINLRYDIEGTFDQIRRDPEKTGWFGAISLLRATDETNLINYDLQFFLDEEKINQTIATISSELDIPAQDPEIKFDKATGVVSVTAGENGQEVEEGLLKQRMIMAIKNITTSPIEIPVRQLRPKLSESQIENVKVRASGIVNKQLTLSLPEENLEWKIETEQLIKWLDPMGSGWKEMEISTWVDELAKTIDRPALNASFRFVEGGKVEEFRPEKDGHEVKKEDLTKKMIIALENLQSTTSNNQLVEVQTINTKPEVEVAEVNNLGIKELIGKGESWFSGSITNRIFNLKKAADALNGVLIAPGETFSFNETVGEISQATGYKSAFIIKEGKTILGDGGGVCQTSSTLFRAVLNAGLPIEQRAAHAYRVSYYEQNYQPGFDATIFQPAPDFKFTNDTGAHVLIQTKFDEAKKYLAVEFYGTSDGRVAEVSKARIWDIVAPPPDLYIDDPNLPVGKVVQTEHAAKGSKVAFDWKVTRNGEVLQERTFFSNYKAWQGVYLRGTKTN